MHVPGRIGFLAALILSVLGIGARAQEVQVTGDHQLDSISTSLATMPGPTLTLRMGNHAHPGRLKIDQPYANISTLRIEPLAPESDDSAIVVDSFFIDAKNYAGTLVLKGLAFVLKPKAVLIAGYDPNKPNRNLILDSCFIYADTLEGGFLTWQGDLQSQVEMKSSWFVVKQKGGNIPSMQLGANSIALSNCLFNFPGLITASPVYYRFDAFYNTFNRVQLNLGGVNASGTEPAFSFSNNLAAYHGTVNSLGGTDFYLLRAAGFSNSRSGISSNRLYKDWKGINITPGPREDTTVFSETTADGKTASELWNWYTDSTDATTGMLAGNTQLQRYNTLPGQVSADVPSGGKTLRVYFRGTTFPRNFRFATLPPPAVLDSAFRIRESFPYELSFGPFAVQRMESDDGAEYGKPVLLSRNGSGGLVPQAVSGGFYNMSPSVFVNNDPGARSYVLVDSGNTPRGRLVEPLIPQFESSTHLRFGKVSQSGWTNASTNPDTAMPGNLRYLNRSFGFSTNALADSVFDFAMGLDPATPPWSSREEDQLYWYWKRESEPAMQIKAERKSIWGDSLVYGSLPFNFTNGRFNAFLVERLSLSAGDTSKVFSGITVESRSARGYQFRLGVDSTLDLTAFGSASPGYVPGWTGRGAGDLLYLLLPKPSADVRAFVKVPSKAQPESVSAVVQGEYLKVPVGPDDAGKTFFSGVKLNLLAGKPFTGIIDGVLVDSLISSASAKLSFRNLDSAAARALGSNADSLFRNARYLGGKTAVDPVPVPAADFSLAFGIRKFLEAAAVETWMLENGTWRMLTAGHAVPVADSIRIRYLISAHASLGPIAVVERFQAPDKYVTPAPVFAPDILKFSLNINQPVNPLLGYVLEVRTIDASGGVAVKQYGPKAQAETVTVVIDHDLGYAYRVVYLTGKAGEDTASLPGDYQYPPQYGWDPVRLLNAAPDVKQVAQGRWRLASLPARASLRQLVAEGVPVRDDSVKIKDTTLVLDLSTRPDQTAFFDTLTAAGRKKASLDSIAMWPGKAYLIASSRPFTVGLDLVKPAPAAVTPKPEIIPLKAGWNLIGNPYPIPLALGKVRSIKGHPVRLLALVRDDLSNSYSWESVDDTLRAFTGYACSSSEEDTLSLDPAYPTAAAAGKVATGDGSIRIRMSTPFGRSTMHLVRGAGEYPIRFLPAPAARVELRVGGSGGYLFKPVDDLRRVDQPVEIRSAREGIAAFQVGNGESELAFALIDSATGEVFDAQRAKTLPLRQGVSTYRLIAGDPGFVAERAHTFAASLPAALALSQNFPNPARGLTRIAVDWPAAGNPDRRAYLEVLDTRGRRVARREIGGIRAGRQFLDFDAAQWNPGVYLYRLVVSEGGRTTRLQKRMLVTP